jgi:O-antigen/teichoic acid export membrane protein
VLELSKLALIISFLASGGFGIRELLLAAVGASLMALLFSSFFFIREYRRVFIGVRSASENLLLAAGRRYGMWVSLRYGFGKVSKSARPWLIKFFVNTEAVALYALGVNIISLAQGLMPIGMLGRLLPWELKDSARFRFIFLRSVKYALWIGLAMAVGGAIILPPLITFIFPKYAPAVPVLLALLLTLPFYGVYKIHKSVLGVLREQKVLSLRVMTEAGLVVGLNAILLPLIGIIGVGVEYALTYAWRILFFHRELARRRPELAIKLKYFFSFDAADREFFAKVMSELVRFFGRMGQAVSRS